MEDLTDTHLLEQIDQLLRSRRAIEEEDQVDKLQELVEDRKKILDWIKKRRAEHLDVNDEPLSVDEILLEEAMQHVDAQRKEMKKMLDLIDKYLAKIPANERATDKAMKEIAAKIIENEAEIKKSNFLNESPMREARLNQTLSLIDQHLAGRKEKLTEEDLKEIATMIIMQGRKEELNDFSWPDRVQLNYEMFSTAFYEAIKKRIDLNDTSERLCEADQKTQQASKQAPEQEIAKLVLTPSAPYNGIMLYHAVGTGKTRVALSMLGKFRKNPDTRLIWITTIRAKVSVRTQVSDFPSFGGGHENPFQDGPSEMNHRAGKIALFTYKEFVNSLHKIFDEHQDAITNKYGEFVLTERKKEKGDPLADTIIVIDEAQKIFEQANGAGKDQYLIERAAYESYAHARANNDHRACRWIILTATPMPTIEVPTDTREAPETAGGPHAALRLLNMLISDKKDRLPIDHNRVPGKMPQAFYDEVPDGFDELTGVEYAKKAKGLVSYFEPEWPHIFASIEGENDITTVKLEANGAKHITRKLNATCGPAIKSKNGLSVAQCYLRRLHWFGNYLAPRNKGRKKHQSSDSSGAQLPGNLLAKCDKNGCIGDNSGAGALNHLNVPRARTLYETIRDADRNDMEKFGKKFKHVIYSSMKNYTADMYASALILASEDDKNNDPIVYNTPTQRYQELGLKVKHFTEENTGDKHNVRKIALTGGESVSDAGSSNVMFFMHDDLNLRETDEMLLGFNDHERNNYGQIARILVLGPGRKEALNLHDVKYVHIMEPQITSTDTTQIIGRARRYCSHTGLDPEMRSIRIFIYGLALPQRDLKLRELGIDGQDLENGELSRIAHATIKSTDVKMQQDLAGRQKILSWMKLVAIDPPLVNKVNLQEVVDHVGWVQAQLPLVDQAAAALAVPIKRYSADTDRKLTKQLLLDKCRERGIQINKSAKKTELLRCCGPEVKDVPEDCGPKKRGREEAPLKRGPPGAPRGPRTGLSINKLKEMCADPSRPGGPIKLKSSITTKQKLTECCAEGVTLDQAAALGCVSSRHKRKNPDSLPPPNQPIPLKTPPNVPRQILSSLNELCPDKQVRNEVVAKLKKQEDKAAFLQYCADLGFR
jgi:hypothetical protein